MSVGSVFTEQRKKLGHDLPAMASYLRIRLPYLQAIEKDDFASLPPGDAYRVGFLKSYADALDLDVEEIVAQYHVEQGATQKMPLRVRMPIKEESGMTLGLIGILAALVVAGWIGFAYVHHHSDRSIAEEVPPVPDRLQPQAAAAPAATTAVAGETDEARDEAYAPQGPKPLPATQAAPQAASVHSFGDGPSRVTVAIVADTWLQLAQGGKPLFTGVLHAGDTYKIPDQPGWTMTAGNAAGVALAVDGKPGRPLGGVGAAIRDLPLDATSAAGR